MHMTTVWLLELILFYSTIAALVRTAFRYARDRVFKMRAVAIWPLILGFCLLQKYGVAPSFPGYEFAGYGPNGKVTIWTLSFARRGDDPSTMCEWLQFDEAGYKFYLQKPHAIQNPTSPDSCQYALPDGYTFSDDYRGCYIFNRLSQKTFRRIDAGCSGEKSWAEFVSDESQSALFFRYFSP
jgi:hypothetical protein